MLPLPPGFMSALNLKKIQEEYYELQKYPR